MKQEIQRLTPQMTWALIVTLFVAVCGVMYVMKSLSDTMAREWAVTRTINKSMAETEARFIRALTILEDEGYGRKR